MLSGVNVALGVTGSIAAVTNVELIHELRRRGAEVRVLMTESATEIVHPWSLELASENPVATEISGAVEHVKMGGVDGWADVYLIAPSTANTVGKMAGAIDDTPVTTMATTAMGSGVPIVIAPAMHKPMYDHPGVLDAIEQLEEWGVSFVDPRIEEGKAKIATQDAIATETARAAAANPLAGQHVVVTAGATSESFDPVRVLTNRSSGRTGREVAKACYVRGADVTLVHGQIGPRPVDAEPATPETNDPAYADLVSVETASEMIDACREVAGDADVLVSTAAIGDYTRDAADEKLRSGQDLTLDLEPTPKLLDSIRETHPDLPMVGFKVETSGDDDAMTREARDLRDRVGLEFVVANDASVMGETDTRTLFVDDGRTEVVGSKADIGSRVAAELVEIL
ncbi:MAG: phosphopantothenoylcysteine decarboxylase/phosphopantothenate--cysteine ligase [Halobacteriales archaeon]|jgi:phosphopantothenoylcysteine decarboxylase/phosphopantothenate--cysteine ligase